MDLTKLSVRAAADKGAVLHLKDPATGDELFDGDTPVTITLLGAESQAVKDKAKELDRRKLEGEEISKEQSGAELIAATTVAWEGIALHGTDPLPCTFDNAVKLYLDPDADWILEQIGPFARNRRNFVKNRPID